MAKRSMKQRIPTTAFSPSLLFSLLFLVLLNNNSNSIIPTVNASGPTDQRYCGTSWPNAANACEYGCPSGADSECQDTHGLSTNYSCHYFTGCIKAVDEETTGTNDDITDDAQDAGPITCPNGQIIYDTTPVVNNKCGKTWIHAMLGCNESCECGICSDPNERCFAATNCNQELEELVSEMLTTLQGPQDPMEGKDTDIFGGTIFDFINEIAIEEGISLEGVDVGDQARVGRRELQERYNHRALTGHSHYMNFEIKNVTQRKLPSGSSAIDVSMVVTGDYRPPPYLDLDVIAEDSINRQGDKVVTTLRERGERAGREYFSRVEGIEAVRKTDLTKRPTKAPIQAPTMSPFGEPTSVPSSVPTYNPTSVPSTEPSRPLDNVIMTGSREDLQLGGETTSSYGYVFNMRTKPDSPVVLISGFDFYTESTDEVNFELWTRLGTFKDYKGTYDGWDLIAAGTTRGRGIGRYTAIPEEMYTPVSIPGGGVSRAFYLTLDTINLVYKYGVAGDPSDGKYHHDSPDIEIWEGEGVLFYPFPDPSEAYFYRAPRQYLGAIYYNRLPCRPFSLYGEIDVLDDGKCPRVPTQSPTVPPPTATPITLSPTNSPVPPPTLNPTVTPGEPTAAPYIGQTPEPINPTDDPTLSPTESSIPTMSPTTAEPTSSPVVPMRANIITTLRNVPGRNMTPREIEKYIEILAAFLKRHTESTMVLDGIDLWHQELTTTEAKEGTVVSSPTGVDVADEEETAKSPQVARGANKRYLAEQEEAGPVVPKRKKKGPVIAMVAAMDVTLILRVSFANLPPNLLGNMASVAIEENEQELLDLLHEQQAFYTFFKLVDGVSSRTILEVTPPPTPEPTTVAHYEAVQAALEAEELEIVEEEDSGLGFAVFIGLGIGFLWCCLTAISVAYLMSARGEMEEQRDMENLLAAEKANNLKDSNGDDVKTDAAGNVVVDVNSDAKGVRRSSTVPMGDSEEDVFVDKTDSDDSDDPFDQTKNTRLAPTARVELSKSLNKQPSMKSLSELEAEEEAKIAQAYNPKRQSKRQNQGAAMRSVIVTSKENKAMLDGAEDNDRAPLRHSAGAKIMGKDAQRRSLTDSALKASLTAQRARARSIIEKSGEGLRSSGSSFRKSAKRTSESLRRSSTSTNGSSDNLEGLKQSSTSLKRSVRASSTGRQSMRASSTGRASSNGRASMRSSVRQHGSSENMRSSMRASTNKGSKVRSTSNRRSVRKEGIDLTKSDTQNRRHSGNID